MILGSVYLDLLYYLSILVQLYNNCFLGFVGLDYSGYAAPGNAGVGMSFDILHNQGASTSTIPTDDGGCIIMWMYFYTLIICVRGDYDYHMDVQSVATIATVYWHNAISS